MQILGIETSCDETGIAIYDSEKGLLGHTLHSQASLHAQYGGTVPELASRDHIQRLIPLTRLVFEQANSSEKDITAIAYTKGPGLIGALLTGASFAKALGYAWKIPTIGVHHLEGHLLAALLETPAPTFPFVALLVSGGHTMLVHVTDIGHYTLLGNSLDDAAGEAFDKTARALNLGYPGGPAIEKSALNGISGQYTLPRPLTARPGLDFSFSGLKTAVINTIKKTELNNQAVADIALAFQDAVIDTLIIKSKRALEQTGCTNLVIAGGVGANKALRNKIQSIGNVFFPSIEFCTDNGAMIAFSGYQHLLKQQIDPDWAIEAKARWSLADF